MVRATRRRSDWFHVDLLGTALSQIGEASFAKGVKCSSPVKHTPLGVTQDTKDSVPQDTRGSVPQDTRDRTTVRWGVPLDRSWQARLPR